MGIRWWGNKVLVSYGEVGTLSLVPSRADLDASYFVNWSQFGVPDTEFGNPSDANTSQSTIVEVSMQAGGNFMRRDQNMLPDSGSGWAGNFAPGASLLWTNTLNDMPNSITLKLPEGITGVGTQIQANYTGPFTARIEAFDSDNTSLGSFVLTGESTTGADNTALFIGVSNPTPIASVAFTILSANVQIANYAIDQVNFSANFTP